MMQIDQIRQTVQQMLAACGSSNLQQLCAAQQILLLQSDMGRQENACKGFFLQQDQVRCITINASLDEDTQRIVLAHELGHAMLHSSYTDQSFHDFGLFCDHSQLEYEANLFAAELLLDDHAVFSALQECDDFFCMAKLLCVPPQLLDFKLRILKKCDLLPIDAPIVSHGDFLKHYTGSPHEICTREC